MTTLTMRYLGDLFVVTGLNITSMHFSRGPKLGFGARHIIPARLPISHLAPYDDIDIAFDNRRSGRIGASLLTSIGADV